MDGGCNSRIILQTIEISVRKTNSAGERIGIKEGARSETVLLRAVDLHSIEKGNSQMKRVDL
jgi:hypothetical protein